MTEQPSNPHGPRTGKLDPDPHPTVALPQVEATSPSEQISRIEPPAPLQPERKSRRGSVLAVGALCAVMLGLGALLAWLFMRPTSLNPATAVLPPRAVALINSTTPIAMRASPLTVKDEPGEMLYAPDSEGWSDALREAARAREEGRYDEAISQYSALVGAASSKEERDALWGLAATYADAGHDELAIRSYSLYTFLRDDPRAARAFYRIGELQMRNGLKEDAARSFGEYARRAGPAGNAAALINARAYWSSEDTEDIYENIVADNPGDVDLRAALLGLADAKSRLGKHREAADLYDRLAKLRKSNPRPALDNTGDPAEVKAAEQMRLAGDLAGARSRLLTYINSGGTPGYPFGAYSALTSLTIMGVTPTPGGEIAPLQAARIAFRAQRWNRAKSELEAARASNLSPAEAAEASLMAGRAYALTGDYATALTWYTGTLKTYPTSPQAPEAARRAGDILTEQSEWDAALGTYKQEIATYPNAPDTQVARTRAGVLAFRLEQRELARDLLTPAAASTVASPTLRAEGLFWLGKVRKSLGDAAWKDDLKKVMEAAPGTYFSFRARSLLAGEPEGGPVVPTFEDSKVAASSLGVQYGSEVEERREILTWADGQASTAQGRASSPTAAPASDRTARMEARLSSDPEVQRAAMLLRVGAEVEATEAFAALVERLRAAGDTSGLAQVVMFLRYHAPADLAMQAAETLAEVSREKGLDPLTLPRLLLRTLYPTPYSSLVFGEAKARQIDPLVVYALMRQESRFKPDARSHADARGLMQVIPSTGEGIAQQLDDPSFNANDLFLPHVGVRYGTYYLASNLPQFDRKLMQALAAYNGGPGNAARWYSGSALLDPDLYAERIDLFETADYLQRVYENYGYYRNVYPTK